MESKSPMIDTDEKEALLALMELPRIGAGLAQRLLRAFGSARAVWSAGREAWQKVEGIGPILIQRLEEGLQPEAARTILQKLEAIGGSLLLEGQPGYPAKLQALPSPPPLLYQRGRSLAETTDAEAEDTGFLAIVGTRQPDRWGEEWTASLVASLVAKKQTILSGGALGIDTIAHKAAIAHGGTTVAVLGCGVDIPYPPQNRALFQEIIDSGGTILSEHPPGIQPDRGHFPRRNRLIAALSKALIVIQCSEQSGALNAAEHARRLQVPVLTFPGRPQDRLAAGPHLLLRQGARLVESAEEILSLTQTSKKGPSQLSLWPLPPEAAPPPSPAPKVQRRLDPMSKDAQNQAASILSKEALLIWTQLGETPLHIDRIAEQSALPVSQISAQLLLLELQGWIASYPGMNFSRRLPPSASA